MPFRTAILLALCFFATACTTESGGEGDAGTDAGAVDAGRPGPYATCAEGGFSECFSNHDCDPADTCLNLGADPNFVPCCVPGRRGALAAGEVCDPATGESQCTSGICVEGSAGSRCSDTCTVDSDCPVGMQRCTFIAFSSSNDNWCLLE